MTLKSIVRRRYTVRFMTPAFLGDAGQAGEWRTPPFKALLREWWRVVKFNQLRQGVLPQHLPTLHQELREAEGRLFGHAWLKDDRQAHWSARAKVQIKLAHWSQGKQREWTAQRATVKHPEVPRPVDAALYLGYGPLAHRMGTVLKSGSAIQAGETNTLSLACPAEDADHLHQALQLIHAFGTVGGRCRNGWGSLALEDQDQHAVPLQADLNWLSQVVRPLGDCLALDWPHALGRDDTGLLIWQTRAVNDWPAVITELARIKIALRTHFKFTPHQSGTLQARHVLAYPVTHHRVTAWGKEARLANSLRFKIAATGTDCIGIVYHMPCALPATLPHNSAHKAQLPGIWRQVHTILDEHLSRSRGLV